MAERACEELSALNFKHFAVSVLRSNLNVVRALGKSSLTGERQTAFKTALLAAVGDNLGIYELDYALSDVDYNNTSEHSDLRSGKSYAVCKVHCLCHILEQNSELSVEFFNRAALLFKNRIAVLNNVSDSHFYIFLTYKRVHIRIGGHVGVLSVCAEAYQHSR